MPALMLKLKSGPASPGALVAVDGGSGGGDAAMGGHHRCGGGQPHHGSVKWAPPWTTRRIGSGGEEGFSLQPGPCLCSAREALISYALHSPVMSQQRKQLSLDSRTTTAGRCYVDCLSM